MLTISEYANATVLAGGAPIPAEPNLRTLVLEVGSASQASEPFGPAVKFIRVHNADGAVALKFGPSPVATPADAHMSANSTELFAVLPGHRVAAVAIGEVRDMEGLALLRVLADPKAAQARSEELAATTAASNKAAAEAKAATEEATRAQAVLAVKQHKFDTRATALATARQDLDAQAAKLSD